MLNAIFEKDEDEKYNNAMSEACDEYYTLLTSDLDDESTEIREKNKYALPCVYVGSHGRYQPTLTLPGYEEEENLTAYSHVRSNWINALNEPDSVFHDLATSLFELPEFNRALTTELDIMWRFEIIHIVRGAYRCTAFRKTGQMLKQIYPLNEVFKIFQNAFEAEKSKGTEPVKAAYYVVTGALPIWDWEASLDVEKGEGRIIFRKDANIACALLRGQEDFTEIFQFAAKHATPEWVQDEAG